MNDPFIRGLQFGLGLMASGFLVLLLVAGVGLLYEFAQWRWNEKRFYERHPTLKEDREDERFSKRG